MNIKKEIDELQKQIDILKKKQDKQDKQEYIEVDAGQLFIDTDNDEKVFIYNICNRWGYSYDDGSGDSFDTKKALENYLSDEQNGFIFYSKKCVFKTN